MDRATCTSTCGGVGCAFEHGEMFMIAACSDRCAVPRDGTGHDPAAVLSRHHVDLEGAPSSVGACTYGCIRS